MVYILNFSLMSTSWRLGPQVIVLLWEPSRVLSISGAISSLPWKGYWDLSAFLSLIASQPLRQAPSPSCQVSVWLIISHGPQSSQGQGLLCTRTHDTVSQKKYFLFKMKLCKVIFLGIEMLGNSSDRWLFISGSTCSVTLYTVGAVLFYLCSAWGGSSSEEKDIAKARKRWRWIFTAPSLMCVLCHVIWCNLLKEVLSFPYLFKKKCLDRSLQSLLSELRLQGDAQYNAHRPLLSSSCCCTPVCPWENLCLPCRLRPCDELSWLSLGQDWESPWKQISGYICERVLCFS